MARPASLWPGAFALLGAAAALLGAGPRLGAGLRDLGRLCFASEAPAALALHRARDLVLWGALGLGVVVLASVLLGARWRQGLLGDQAAPAGKRARGGAAILSLGAVALLLALLGPVLLRLAAAPVSGPGVAEDALWLVVLGGLAVAAMAAARELLGDRAA